MVLTTKQTKANAPATPSRSSSSTAVTPKATRRASLNVKPATSIPTPALKETYVDGTGSSLPPEVRNPSAVLTTNPKHDHAGPFADNPKFLASPKKASAARKVRARTVKRHSKAPRKRRTTEHLSDIVTLLTKIAFLLFSIYSLLVCPKDVRLESPVCRGLDHYRKSIVDPYILPPLRAAASHPAIAPQIERVRPYVDHAVDVVKTQYHIVHDRAVLATEPYMILARKQYNAKARPQLKLMQYNMRRYQAQAQPYIDLVKAKAFRAWYQAEAYVLPVLSKLEQVPKLLKRFMAKPLEEGKERWVDPQVKKIVDKVHEMSANASAAVVAEEKSAPSDGTSATTEKATFYSSPSIAAAVLITEATSTTVEEAPAPTVPEPVPEKSPQNGIVGAPPTPATVTSGMGDLTKTASAESTMDPLDGPLTNQDGGELAEDLDSLEELEKWVSEALIAEETTTSVGEPAMPTGLTEEEKAEKERILEKETQAKRRDITSRHTKWEEDLEALIAHKRKELQEFIEKSRQQALEEVSSPQSPARSQLSILETQLDEAIESTRKTLAKMQADWEDESSSSTPPRWAQILEKVERTFSKKLEKVSEDLGGWVATWMERESRVLQQVGEEIKALADKAQNDLIADYAWLNDVTYRDWERYHDLMYRHREAEEEFQELFDDDLSEDLSNPVRDEIARIRDEIDKVAVRFKEGIDKIRKEGKYILGKTGENTTADRAAAKATETAAGEPEDPTFSILPIDVEGGVDNILQGGGVIIGKSKEQVEQALLMAEEAPAKAGKREEL